VAKSTLADLREYYAGLGLDENAWHVGPEHPALEDLGIRLLERTREKRVLEIGVQSGGFAAPVILAMAHHRSFAYTGIDNLEYTNAVPLSRIADFVRERGVTATLRLVEGESTPVLRAAAPFSYDLILIDHYKPKYAFDLYDICARELLSADGAIVLHDVLGSGAAAWRDCQPVCRAFGYGWEIDADVPQGAAVVRRGPGPREATWRQWFVRAKIAATWHTHAAILRTRRAIGRWLRAAGIRR